MTPMQRRRLVKDIAPAVVQKNSDTELEDGEIAEDDDSNNETEANSFALNGLDI